MALSPEVKARVQAIRMELLDLHKLLLDRERNIYELSHGGVGSPGEYLSLVLEHEQFAWLRELSGVIVALDELISTRTKQEDAEANAAVEKIQSLLRIDEHGSGFQQRYYAAIQDSPQIVIAHCKWERL